MDERGKKPVQKRVMLRRQDFIQQQMNECAVFFWRQVQALQVIAQPLCRFVEFLRTSCTGTDGQFIVGRFVRVNHVYLSFVEWPHPWGRGLMAENRATKNM